MVIARCGALVRWRGAGGAANSTHRWRCGGLRQLRAAAPLAGGRVFQDPRCTGRFAKPAVMQGVPLPTRGRSRTAAGRKSGTRRSGAAARAASARPATSVKCQCRVSVASRTLKLSVAQVLRLQWDYFKLDN